MTANEIWAITLSILPWAVAVSLMSLAIWALWLVCRVFAEDHYAKRRYRAAIASIDHSRLKQVEYETIGLDKSSWRGIYDGSTKPTYRPSNTGQSKQMDRLRQIGAIDTVAAHAKLVGCSEWEARILDRRRAGESLASIAKSTGKAIGAIRRTEKRVVDKIIAAQGGGK